MARQDRGELDCSTPALAAANRRMTSRSASAMIFSSVPTAHKGAGKEIRAADPGGWRRHMSAAEQRAMYEVMGSKLAEVGYLPRFTSERVA